jgi:hypothetical protein
MEPIDIDLILFFKYLKGLQEEKSVKALSFKLEKHPSTIRRMIKKVEDFFSISLVIYENYQCILTDYGHKFLDKYEEIQENIMIEDLASLIEKKRIEININVNKEFFLPYVLFFIKKNNIKFKNLTVTNEIKENNCLVFADNISRNNFYTINLFFFKHKINPVDEVIIHQDIYLYLKKILDFSIFNEIIIVNNLYVMKTYIDNNYSFIGYNNFVESLDDWIIKPINFTLKIYSNYEPIK